MSPEETSLACLLVALPGFAWALGMVGIDPAGVRWVVYVVSDDMPIGVLAGDPRVRPSTSAIPRGTVPDLVHMGTAGILLGVLWTADPCAGWHVHGPPGLICVHNGDISREFYGDSLGVAVARALISVGRTA